MATLLESGVRIGTQSAIPKGCEINFWYDRMQTPGMKTWQLVALEHRGQPTVIGVGTTFTNEQKILFAGVILPAKYAPQVDHDLVLVRKQGQQLKYRRYEYPHGFEELSLLIQLEWFKEQTINFWALSDASLNFLHQASVETQQMRDLEQLIAPLFQLNPYKLLPKQIQVAQNG